MRKVAVVILNWNGERLLQDFLPSVLAHTPPEWADVIVADNASTDRSVSILEQQFPSVQVIRFEKNYGFAGGYNRAIQQLNHPYVVLLNSDVEVTRGWLDAPIQILEQNEGIAGVQPKILSFRDKTRFEYAGACGGYIDKLGYPFCRGRIFNVVEEDHGQYDTIRDIFWASGACLIIRSDLYKEVGGLDEYFFAHQEEIDLCWRLKIKGYLFLSVPQSVVYHVGGATLETEHPQKTFLNFRNNLLMLYKNMPAERLDSVLHIRFWLDYLAALHFFLKGDVKNASAIYRARKEFYEIKYRFSQKRERIQAIPQVNFFPEMLSSPLLMDFYLKGKKKFSDLSF